MADQQPESGTTSKRVTVVKSVTVVSRKNSSEEVSAGEVVVAETAPVVPTETLSLEDLNVLKAQGEAQATLDMTLAQELAILNKQKEEEELKLKQQLEEAEIQRKLAEEQEAAIIRAAMEEAQNRAAAEEAEKQRKIDLERAAEEQKKKEEGEAAAIIKVAMEEAARKEQEAELIRQAMQKAQQDSEAAALAKQRDDEAAIIKAAMSKSQDELKRDSVSYAPPSPVPPPAPSTSQSVSYAPPTPPPETASLSRLRFGSVSSPGISRSSSRGNVATPLARSAADGPVVPLSAVTAAVRATNPILDELLHAIQLLQANDETLTSLDLKDSTILTPALGAALADGLVHNTNLKELNLVNTKIQNATAVDLANALKVNAGLEVLNLESNQIGPQGIKALAESLEKNSTLRELRLANQKSPAGTDAEQSFAKALQKNQSLVKLGLLIRDVASRGSVDRAITRNKEIARKARLAAGK